MGIIYINIKYVKVINKLRYFYFIYLKYIRWFITKRGS